jgi:hypothetical protein
LAHMAALHRRRHQLKVVRQNNTHSWVHSQVLSLELPQPWDASNLTSIVRWGGLMCDACAMLWCAAVQTT